MGMGINIVPVVDNGAGAEGMDTKSVCRSAGRSASRSTSRSAGQSSQSHCPRAHSDCTSPPAQRWQPAVTRTTSRALNHPPRAETSPPARAPVCGSNLPSEPPGSGSASSDGALELVLVDYVMVRRKKGTVKKDVPQAEPSSRQ